MNFLAHLHLSSDDPQALIGSILPDLVRGRLSPTLPPRVMLACRLHQAVDAYTDHHPIFAQSRERFRPAAGRLAGVVTDIFYDHILASHWNDYHPQPLQEFAAATYASLKASEQWLPENSRVVLDRMIEHNWLAGYSQMAGMVLTLQGMSRRLTERFGREVDLSACTQAYIAQQDLLRADFDEFFPQLIAYAQRRSPEVCRFSA